MTISCLSNYADQCMPIIAHFLLEWIPPAQHIAKWSIQNTRQQIFKCIFNQNNKSKTKIHSLYLQALYISTTFTTPISLSKFGEEKNWNTWSVKKDNGWESVCFPQIRQKRKKWKQLLIFVKTQVHNCYLHTPGFRIMKTKTIFITNTNTISNTNTNTYERLLHCSYISFSALFQTKSSFVWKSYIQKLRTIFQTNSSLVWKDKNWFYKTQVPNQIQIGLENFDDHCQCPENSKPNSVWFGKIIDYCQRLEPWTNSSFIM